ncbi:MAG TPA: response regulator [bacterium]|nr:response regulator [bacterium]
MSSGRVVLVDDDLGVLKSLSALFESVGLEVQAFAHPQEVLNADPPRPGCVVLDLRMPDMSGLEVYERLRERWKDVPTIFITAHGEVSAAVRAMKMGARDFLEKPFPSQDLLDRVQEALEFEEQGRAARVDRDEIRKRLATLTRRERDVLKLIVEGLSSKMIASDLGISMKTVEAHRTSTMQKMQARNAAELVRLTLTAGSLDDGD